MRFAGVPLCASVPSLGVAKVSAVTPGRVSVATAEKATAPTKADAAVFNNWQPTKLDLTPS